ncbi:MAG: hypothetical protein OXD54_09230 [Candidatus Poribacteria bacterium]|nr:hypothetical protein [Candidatus Poribacteria bacterium]
MLIKLRTFYQNADWFRRLGFSLSIIMGVYLTTGAYTYFSKNWSSRLTFISGLLFLLSGLFTYHSRSITANVLGTIVSIIAAILTFVAIF